MLLLYANFLVEVRKDGQGARTQLQLAAKNNTNIVERYFIYVTSEMVKSLKSEGVGLDLLGYVEFQRNYRWAVQLTYQVFVVVWTGLQSTALVLDNTYLGSTLGSYVF